MYWHRVRAVDKTGMRVVFHMVSSAGEYIYIWLVDNTKSEKIATVDNAKNE